MPRTNILLLFFFLVLAPLTSQARLLDKIIAVFNNKPFTLSEVNRIRANLSIRNQIAPQVYGSLKNPSNTNLIDLLISNEIIKDKLQEMGIVITDPAVEDEIKALEDRLKINRETLKGLLKQNNISYSEYFELIRTSIEQNVFKTKVINPLIAISDNEIKSEFYKKFSTSKSISFKYTLTLYFVDKDYIKNALTTEALHKALREYQISNVLVDHFSNIEANNLGTMTEDGLQKELFIALQDLEEENFTRPIALADKTAILYLHKKELVESDDFLKSKEMIKKYLYDAQSSKVFDSWLTQERKNYFIEIFTDDSRYTGV